MSVLVFLIASLYSCDNDNMVFHEKNGLYFETDKEVDSIYYSFLGRTLDLDTLNIPVVVMGSAMDKNRNYKVEVVQNLTTAKEGLHYKKLSESYVFGANKFKDYFQMVVSQEDPDLTMEDKIITLKIVESDDFDTGYKDRTTLKIYITNKLIKPSYWDNFLFIFFGEYSKVKHELAIGLMGHDFPFLMSEATSPSAEHGITYWMIQGRALASYIIDNEVFDENGNKIYPWPVS